MSLGKMLRSAPCWIILAGLLLAFLTVCALDTDKLDRTREDIRALCKAPLSIRLRSFCDREFPDLSGPVELPPLR